MPDISSIRRIPGLREIFTKDRWQNLFPAAVLKRAGKYANPRVVRSIKIETTDSEIVDISSVVTGNRRYPYKTSLEFHPENGRYSIYAYCSCPVRVNCKHCVALLLLIAAEVKKSPAQDTGLSLDIDSWLHSLTEPNEGDFEKRPSSNYHRFLAYCLHLPDEDNKAPTLSLHLGSRNKSGTLRIDTRSNASADPVKPPKYMAASDFFPALLYRQLLQAAYYSYASEVTLEGAKGYHLLQEVLKTERLFLLNSNEQAHSVKMGAEILATPTWKNHPDGSTQPCLDLPEAATLLPTIPLLALAPAQDRSEFFLHPVRAENFSDHALLHWQHGPIVSKEETPKLTQHLHTLPEQLPPPKTLASKTLPKAKPTARLTLIRENPFSHAGLHLSGQPISIIAKLELLYHGSAAPPPAHPDKKQPNFFTVLDENSLLKIPRHKSEERRLGQLLHDTCDVEPASALDRTPLEHFFSFLPIAPPREWDLAWASIITNSLPLLQEQGWEIIIDPSAEIAIHPIGPESLETGLNEIPDHGIDWFQFGASYLTPTGEKQSLIPLLTTYLQTIDPNMLESALAEASEDKETILRDPDSGALVSINTRRLLNLVKSIHDLFGFSSPSEPIHRIQAADLADSLELDSSATLRALAELGRNLKNVDTLPTPQLPKALTATLRDYQVEGFHWMQFLARHSLHGILADDMGLGKTLQALTHIQAEVSSRRTRKRPTLVIAPTSVVGNWAAEASKFTPKLKVLTLHGPDRKEQFRLIPKHHLILTSYALLVRDFEELSSHQYHLLILDEAQYIKNPAAKVSQFACKIDAAHRLSLSGTPLENHLGELWSQMRFLMPGLLGSSEVFRKSFRTPIERHGDKEAQLTLNRRVAPLLLRRTKEEVATELPPKTEIIHTIPLHKKQVDLYETIRAAMDKRVRDAIQDKGLAKSHIIVLDALLKLRQICCHPQLLKLPAAKKVTESAKLDFLTTDLLPTLLEEGRRILLFSSFTSMLALIEAHLNENNIPFAKITGNTKNRQEQVEQFQKGDLPVFLISLKAGGTGLNLTAADTVIHYDPWWNPAAENQATDRAHRIGQTKPVFVHKLLCEGSIEQRIQELQSKKAALVEALLTADTNRLKLDQSTLNNLLAPLPVP